MDRIIELMEERDMNYDEDVDHIICETEFYFDSQEEILRDIEHIERGW